MAGSWISHVLVIPADQKDIGDRVAIARGYTDPGAETYVVRLSATGLEPASHFAVHTWETAQFLATWNQTAAGHPPDEDWAAHGLTEQQVIELAKAQTITTRADGVHEDHFASAIGQLGLKVIPGPGPGGG